FRVCFGYGRRFCGAFSTCFGEAEPELRLSARSNVGHGFGESRPPFVTLQLQSIVVGIVVLRQPKQGREQMRSIEWHRWRSIGSLVDFERLIDRATRRKAAKKWRIQQLQTWRVSGRRRRRVNWPAEVLRSCDG